jgi:ubiquilin
MAQMQAMMGGGAGGSAASTDTRPPKEKYAEQIAQIKEMGFNDEDAIAQILEQTGGNVQLALERLFQ